MKILKILKIKKKLCIIYNYYYSDKPFLEWNDLDWERWINSPIVLKRIKKTPFIISKSPLSTVYEEKYGFNSFTVNDLMNLCYKKELEILNCIDLSLTNNFFHKKSEWDDWDVNYYQLPGNNKVINERNIYDFEKVFFNIYLVL